jgi:hypothetical protein
LGRIGDPATFVVPALIQALLNPNTAVSQKAAEVLRRIGDPAVPALNEARRHERAEVRLAVMRILLAIAPESLADDSSVGEPKRPVLSEEDKRILTWFKDVDLTEYLTPLQLFWCIGQVDRAALESEGRAVGYSKLVRKLKQVRPTYAEIRLPTSNGYIRQGCLDVVYALLDKEPFYSNAWTDDERAMEFRVQYMSGRREEGQWTRKARKAFHYVDRFLSIMKCLPKITITEG